MKKMIRLFAASALMITMAFSVSARPSKTGKIIRTQPDGSKIEVTMHGDEFHHWMTSDGVVVAKDSDGYIRPVVQTAAEKSKALRRAAALRQARKRPTTIRKAPVTGPAHSLVVLVEFSDLKYSQTNPQSAFSDLLNKKGYNTNGAVGSAFDYFYENSGGKFQTTFDVVGPVTLSNTMAYYGQNDSNGNDKQPVIGFIEACSQLNSSVNFADYDNDGDGYVDEIFFFFAGYNEAEGGPENAIWPYQWDVASELSSLGKTSVNYTFDGVKLGSFACASEFFGSSGSQMCGIGTFCHEYGHVLGLPDFYDTDYEDNGEATDMLFYSLMASGCDNNDGKCPPYLTTIEKDILEWMEMPEYLSKSGQYTLNPVQNNVAWLLRTDVENEFYVLECRGSEGWDAGLDDAGLLIYHVDKSTNKVGGKTAASKWEDLFEANDLNAYSNHPLCCVVPSNPEANYYADDYLFPGYVKATAFDDTTDPAAKGWSGNATGHYVRNIAYSNNAVTFTYTNGDAAEFSFNAIANPGNGVYQAGESFALSLVQSGATPKSVKWLFDGIVQAGSSVTLTTGLHTVSAVILYEDNSSELLEQKIKVQ